MGRPTLILCIDRDNDLFEKAKVSGPLIGREKNIEGAVALSLADPEDPDSNAIFYSVKLFDQLRHEGETVEVATLTGDKKLGYKADKEISAQLDKICQELHPESCILVTDGVADEEVIPVIKSRLKIDSSKIVFIKQAKELEKTYVVILEKLRDPYFARTILGIPAILILLLSVSSYLGYGLEPIGVIIGIYLMLRIFSIDEMIIDVFRDFRFSFERTSWISYIGAFAIFTIGLFVGVQTFQKGLDLALSNEKLGALIFGNTSWIFYIALLIIMIGKSIDAILEKKKFRVTKYILYSAAAGLSTFVIFVGSSWIVNLYEPYVDFGRFLFSIAASLVAGYFVTSFVNWYRKEILADMKIEGKEVINEQGTYLGKIVGMDAKRERMILQNVFDKRYTMPLSSIVSVEDNVVLRA